MLLQCAIEKGGIPLDAIRQDIRLDCWDNQRYPWAR
jgi:hypothetical protein